MSQSTADIPGTTTSLEEQHTVEQFLYREARMLDDRLYMDWLGLLTDDCTYRVPIRENVQAVRGKPAVTIEDELSGLAYFDDDKLTLTAKALRLGTGTAWGENPPSRTRRMVSNVEVTKPPITTTARGFCTSEPGPVAKSMGAKPRPELMAVISTGRRRRSAPSCTASNTVRPTSRNWLK